MAFPVVTKLVIVPDIFALSIAMPPYLFSSLAWSKDLWLLETLSQTCLNMADADKNRIRQLDEQSAYALWRLRVVDATSAKSLK